MLLILLSPICGHWQLHRSTSAEPNKLHYLNRIESSVPQTHVLAAVSQESGESQQVNANNAATGDPIPARSKRVNPRRDD